MNALKLAVGTLVMSMANLVFAGNSVPQCPGTAQCLPMEDGGLFAVAALLLVTGIKIIRQKRGR